MKKTIKLFILLMAMITTIFVNQISIHAISVGSTVESKGIMTGISIDVKVSKGVRSMRLWGERTVLRVRNQGSSDPWEQALCIDPFTLVIHGGGHVTGELSETYVSNEVAKKYSGYTYLLKKNFGIAQDYEIALQLMLWEDLGYTLQFNSSGLPKTLTQYRSDFDTALANHKVKPNFNTTSVKIDKNNPVVLTDTNGVLNQFQVSTNNASVTASINGNNLTLSSNGYFEGTINIGLFKIANSDIGINFIYQKPNSQSMSSFWSADPVLVTLTVNYNIKTVNINKVDIDTNQPVNATFDIYPTGNTTNKITTVTTTNGTATLQIENGIYDVYEVDVEAPYIIEGNNKQTITIDDSTQTYTLNFANKRTKGELHITKTDSKNQNVVEGAEYRLFEAQSYTLDDMKKEFELVTDELGNGISWEAKGNIALSGLNPLDAITNEQGIASFKNLEVGKYFVIENKSPNGYQIDPNIYEVIIEYEDFSTPNVVETVALENNRMKYEIKGIKVDSSTNEPITSNDFELTLKDSGDNVIAPSKVVDGVHYWMVDSLEIYYMSETNAPEGYLLSDEIIEIDTNTEPTGTTYEIQYFNSPVPKVVVTGNDATTIGYFALFVAALCCLVVVNKNKKSNG